MLVFVLVFIEILMTIFFKGGVLIYAEHDLYGHDVLNRFFFINSFLITFLPKCMTSIVKGLC